MAEGKHVRNPARLSPSVLCLLFAFLTADGAVSNPFPFTGLLMLHQNLQFTNKTCKRHSLLQTETLITDLKTVWPCLSAHPSI